MKKIIFVAPALSGGGAERVLVTLINKLYEMRYRVVVLLTISNVIEYDICSGVKIIVNKGSTSAIGQIKFLRENLKKEKNSTAISFFTFQNMYLLLANLGIKNRIIVSERNDPAKTLYKKKWMRGIRKLLYWTASVLVFQTEDAMHYFPKYISKKGVIIGNPLRETLPEPYKGVRKNKLVAFSRLYKQKNIPMMLKAFKEVLKTNPEYVLELYGKGEEKENLVQTCIALEIDDKVHFKGFSSNVLEEIRDAKVFLLSSDYEGISNSMLEALAIGLPCVCTDCPCGGTRTYITNMENGILVPVGSEKDMARAILQVIHNKELSNKLSHNAIKIRDILSVDMIIKKWIKII